MKVNKEEILAMYVALEHYINQDHEKEWKDWEKRIAHIENTIKPLAAVTTSISVPKLGNVTPNLKIAWDPARIKLTNKELQEHLRTGEPSIEVGGGGENFINVTVWMMKPGQEKIVASRIKEELVKALA